MKPNLRWEQEDGDMLFRDHWGTIWKIRVIDHTPYECPLEIVCLEHHDDYQLRCPRCGSEKWEYVGDRQRCAECGK